MSSLVEHAKRELELCGQTKEDPAFSDSLIRAVEAFGSYGHSGGSAAVAVEMLNKLLSFEPLSRLTNNPEEWTDVTEYSPGVPLWQSNRDPSVFSEDNLKTAYKLGDSGREEVLLNDHKKEEEPNI